MYTHCELNCGHHSLNCSGKCAFATLYDRQLEGISTHTKLTSIHVQSPETSPLEQAHSIVHVSLGNGRQNCRPLILT